eukprot:557176-Pelagomonas_calceolata.AAC.8
MAYSTLSPLYGESCVIWHIMRPPALTCTLMAYSMLGCPVQVTLHESPCPHSHLDGVQHVERAHDIVALSVHCVLAVDHGVGRAALLAEVDHCIWAEGPVDGSAANAAECC